MKQPLLTSTKGGAKDLKWKVFSAVGIPMTSPRMLPKVLEWICYLLNIPWLLLRLVHALSYEATGCITSEKWPMQEGTTDKRHRHATSYLRPCQRVDQQYFP